MRSLLALVSLAISFAVPAFAQEKDSASPQIANQRDLLGVAKALDEFGELDLKIDEAFHRGCGFGRTGWSVCRSTGH
jgi:hypothetical protein